MMKRYKWLFIGIGSLLIALVIWVILKSARTSMIVDIGIVATNALRAVLLWIFIVIGVAAIGFGLYRLVTDIARNSSKDKLKKSSLAYRAKSSGQKEIRDQLMTMKGIRPRLSDEVAKCLAQLDSVNSLYDRFDQLITSNDAQTVSGARIGLEEIERTLISNFKWVINVGIAADNADSPATDTECTQRIERAVKANSQTLEKGNQFLLEIADNISQISAGDTTMLDAWIKTIRDQNKLSLIRTGDEQK